MKPILVTGGAGFIGSHVVDVLLARGREVRVLDDLSGGRVSYLPLHDPNLDLRTGDVGDPRCVAAAVKGCGAVIHLAHSTPRPGIDPYDVSLTNLLGFINVLEAARLARIPRVVYASSGQVYGDATPAPLAEDLPPRPTGPEGMEKLLAEGYAELFARQHGLRVLGLRYFDVYGPRQPRDNLVEACLERLEARRPALLRGDGRQVRDFIHAEDAAHATVAALDSRRTGVLNVGSGQPTQLRELVQLLGFALDLRPLAHFVAARPDESTASVADVRALRATTGFLPLRSLRAGLAALASDRAARRRRGPARAADAPLPRPFVLPEPALRKAF